MQHSSNCGRPAKLSAAAFDPSHPGWIYLGTSTGALGNFWLSTDFGATWTAKASTLTTFSRITNIAVDPDQPNTLVAGTVRGFYKSSDAGSSWTSLTCSLGSFFPQASSPFTLMNNRCAPSGGLFALEAAAVCHSTASRLARITEPLGKRRSLPTLPASQPARRNVDVTRAGTSDAFVAKLAPDGSMLWSTFLGGSDQDVPVALAVDAQGNAYVIGNTTSPDFPSTVPGQGSVFAAKFSAEGRLEYSTRVGGESNSVALAIAVDRSQNAYIAARTNSQNLPVTPGVLVSNLGPGFYTGFLVKLSFKADIVYATYLGESYTYAGAILVDADEEVTIAGTGPVPGIPVPEPLAPLAFVMRLDRSASRVQSSTYIPGRHRPHRSDCDFGGCRG